MLIIVLVINGSNDFLLGPHARSAIVPIITPRIEKYNASGRYRAR